MTPRVPTRKQRDRRSDRDIPMNATACRRAADIFRALGEPSRLRILGLLMQREMCVTGIAEALDDSLSAVSQRLKLLRSERIVTYRREGKRVHYRLADEHIAELVSNALEHAMETTTAVLPPPS